MPPPPPRKEDKDGTATTGSTQGKSEGPNQDNPAPPRAYEPGEKDETLGAKINGDGKVSRQYMLSLGLLLLVTVLEFFSEITGVHVDSRYLDEFGSALGDVTEDREEHELTYEQLFLCAYVFLFVAILMHMYYYAHLRAGSEGAGTLAALTEFFNCRDSTVKIIFWVIVGCYGLGIILYYAAFLSLMAYLFDEEDYSSYYVSDDASDDAIASQNGYKTYFWAVAWCYPLYLGIVCGQHVIPDKLLQHFEVRTCLYSLVLFTGSLIYTIYFMDEDQYQSQIDSFSGDDIEEIEEGNFLGARMLAVVTCLVTLAMVIYSGLATKKIVLGQEESQASDPNVFKIWILLALLLLVSVLVFSIFLGLIGFTGYFGIAGLWIGTIVIVTDILC